MNSKKPQKSNSKNTESTKIINEKAARKKVQKRTPKEKHVQYGAVEIPQWLDCTWKRVRCGLDNCKVCKSTNPSQELRILNGELDDISDILFDIERQLQSALTMISSETRRMGEDVVEIENNERLAPPEPETFPLYKKALLWHDKVLLIEEEAQDVGNLWVFTEAAADMSWYSHVLLSKLYHFLCNEWYMSQNQHIDELDHEYTKYILTKCITSLENSLTELSLLLTPQKGEMMLALIYLKKIQKSIGLS